jgi:hypothetical protein
MTQASKLTLYLIGALLMAIPGLFRTSMRFWFVAYMAVGCLLLVTAAVRHEFTKPKTALLLLIMSNLSFWLSFALWRMRDTLVGPMPRYSGIDPFVGPLVIWLAVLLVLATYETVVFAIGVIANRNRTLAAIGLVAVVVQVLVSVRSIYLMIQGV